MVLHLLEGGLVFVVGVVFVFCFCFVTNPSLGYRHLRVKMNFQPLGKVKWLIQKYTELSCVGRKIK